MEDRIKQIQRLGWGYPLAQSIVPMLPESLFVEIADMPAPDAKALVREAMAASKATIEEEEDDTDY